MDKPHKADILNEKKYRARLIELGRVVNEMEFTALPNEAWNKAHETDSKPYWMTGQWIEITEAKPERNPRLNGK